MIDTLYLTYGSFVLMGVDPEEVFEIVHRANMGKIFPDGQAHFDEVTHKILKPNDWEEKYAPEPAIQKELERQIKAYQNTTLKKQQKLKKIKRCEEIRFPSHLLVFIKFIRSFLSHEPLTNRLWHGGECIQRKTRLVNVQKHLDQLPQP